MGTWGYGILQNDAAQDGVCDVARRIESDVLDLGEGGSEHDAAIAGAATALLLQFSPYSFSPENKFSKKLIDVLIANQDFISKLPGNSAQILNSVINGNGGELAERPGVVDVEIDKALHSAENNHFVMQKAFSVIEQDLFRHPIAADYLQQLLDELVEEVEEGFDDDDMVSDLSREAEFMGQFGLLLVLPKGNTDPAHFSHWRDRFRAVLSDMEPDTDESELEFAERYNSYLEVAFDCGIKRFSS